MHSICPECSSSCVEQTTKGYLFGPDLNRACCHRCGWEGKAWQLAVKYTASEAYREASTDSSEESSTE